MPLFEQAQGFIIQGGNFNDFSTNGLDPLVYLEQYSAPGAMHDSMERYPPPRCHAETRKRALGTIERWGTVPRADREKRLFWLHGPVGMGKTTIAQTIAEEFEAKNILGASFFFSRTDNHRNRAERFVASLALQLAISIPVLKRHVEAALRANPTILRKALPIQLQKLIVEPFRKILPLADDKVVGIDGLDECEGARPNAQDKEKEQLLILHLIETMLEAGLPLNFFLTSRPEAWIQEALEESPLSDNTQRLDLFEDSEKDADVERYFRDQLERIRHSKKHRLCFSKLTEPWPPEDIVQDIIGIAGGQFAYVDVIIRYLDDPYSNPVTQLKLFERVSRPAAANRDDMMQQLDNLYRQILLAGPSRSEMKKFLAWIVYDPEPHELPSVPIRAYETIMGFEPGDMIRALRGLHALIRVPIDGTQDGKAVIYHRSLVEFLYSPKRAGNELYLDRYWDFLLHYRCLVFLSENPLGPLSSGSKPSGSSSSVPRSDSLATWDLNIHVYAKRFRPYMGWYSLHYLQDTPESRSMVIHFARLFISRDPSDDMVSPGVPLPVRDHHYTVNVEHAMVSGWSSFLGEPSLLRECFIHWRSAYRRCLYSNASALGSQGRDFLHTLFDTLHSLYTGQVTSPHFELSRGSCSSNPDLYFDNINLHRLLVEKGLSMDSWVLPVLFPQTSVASLVCSYLPADFYHLLDAVKPQADRLLECAPGVIDRLWVDLLHLGEWVKPGPLRCDQLIAKSRMFDKMLYLLHLVRRPDDVAFLKDRPEAPRLEVTDAEATVVSREIVRCAFDGNMPMALAISSWWEFMIASVACPDPEHKAHLYRVLRDTEAFIRHFDSADPVSSS